MPTAYLIPISGSIVKKNYKTDNGKSKLIREFVGNVEMAPFDIKGLKKRVEEYEKDVGESVDILLKEIVTKVKSDQGWSLYLDDEGLLKGLITNDKAMLISGSVHHPHYLVGPAILVQDW
jgi:hypothetical protein